MDRVRVHPAGRDPQTATPDPRPDREFPLLYRIVIALSLTALIGGALASGASAAMPSTMPGTTGVAHPPQGTPAPTPVTSAAPVPAHLTIPAVLPTRTTEASAYSAWDEGNFCPGFPQTRKMDLTVGSDLVPCGGYVRVCLISGRKCVVAQRRDWGPGLTAKRRLDLNFGVVRALGYKSLYHWGARQVRWEPVSNPGRAVASTP